MNAHRIVLVIIFCTIVGLGLVSFVACMVADIKREKARDLKMDGNLCSLPGHRKAFRFGLVSVLCLSAAQIIGNLVICQIMCSKAGRKCCGNVKKVAATGFLLVSWVSFGTAIVLLSAATSMSRRQPYGRGWLDGQCYLVKNGVYMGSGALILVTIIFTIGSAVISLRASPNEQNKKSQKGLRLQPI